MDKVKAALEAKGIRCEEPAGVQAAHGDFLIVAGLPSKAGPAAELAKSLGIRVPSAPESLLIRNVEWNGKRTLLLSGADDRGLMYSLLEAADRVGWAADRSKPLSEVRDTVESPAVGERGGDDFYHAAGAVRRPPAR
jgi:alpha-glucuronidase